MSCPLPPVNPGVEVITIGEGVIAYQCEEGLVPEGRVEAMCGDDGRWSPDPTQHMCNNTMTTATSTSATSTPITGQDTITEASTNIKVIIGSSVSSAVVLIVVLLLVVLLIWKILRCT